MVQQINNNYTFYKAVEKQIDIRIEEKWLQKLIITKV